MKPTRILMVDDEPDIRQSLSGVLEDEGYAAARRRERRSLSGDLPGSGFELVLLDIWLPGMDGMEVLTRIQEIPFAGAAGGGDDLRPRQHRNGGEGHQAGRLRFSGKAAVHPEDLGGGEERAGASRACRSRTAG